MPPGCRTRNIQEGDRPRAGARGKSRDSRSPAWGGCPAKGAPRFNTGAPRCTTAAGARPRCRARRAGTFRAQWCSLQAPRSGRSPRSLPPRSPRRQLPSASAPDGAPRLCSARRDAARRPSWSAVVQASTRSLSLVPGSMRNGQFSQPNSSHMRSVLSSPHMQHARRSRIALPPRCLASSAGEFRWGVGGLGHRGFVSQSSGSTCLQRSIVSRHS